MLPALLAAFLLGIVAGLRTFTAPAVLWIVRFGGLYSWLFGAAAIIEYALDVHPKAPARTRAVGLTVRILSGALVGWTIAANAGHSAVAGAIAGIAGAL